MTRVFSFVWILLIITLGSVGLMYVADWLASARIDHRHVAVLDVASRTAALAAVQRMGVSLSSIIQDIDSRRVLRGIPILVIQKKDVATIEDVVNVRGLGVECIVIIPDALDPYQGIRRIWVSDENVVQEFRVDGSRVSERLVYPTDSVEGGDPFSHM